MSELDTLAHELRTMANKLRRVLLNDGVCYMETLDTLYLSMGVMREAADTIDILRDRLQATEEGGEEMNDHDEKKSPIEALHERMQEVEIMFKDIPKNPSGFGMKLTDDEIADAVRQLEAEPVLTITDATTGGSDEQHDRAATNL